VHVGADLTVPFLVGDQVFVDDGEAGVRHDPV
jgi:hypothetical protein